MRKLEVTHNSGFAAAFGHFEDIRSLVLWKTTEGKSCLKQKDNVKFLDTKSLAYSTALGGDEKYTYMDVRHCSSIGNIPKVIIIGITRNRIQRWEVSPSLDSNRWECVDLVELEICDLSIQRISLSSSGEMSATFESFSVPGHSGTIEKKYSILIRSEQLRKIRIFSSSQYSSEAAAALLFQSEDLLITAYEKGRILGWSVRSDSLIFDCNILLNKTRICSLAIMFAESRQQDTGPGAGADSVQQFKFFVSLIVGSRDGKLRVVEVDNLTDPLAICRESGILDIQRDTRYLQDLNVCGVGDLTQGPSDFVTSMEDFRGTKDRKNVRLNRGDVAPSVKKESSSVPIHISYFPLDRASGGSNESRVRCAGGMVVATTSTALILISLMPFQVQKYLPLSTLSINTISDASVGVCYGEDGVAVAAVMMTAFERKAAVFRMFVDYPAASSHNVVQNNGTQNVALNKENPVISDDNESEMELMDERTEQSAKEYSSPKKKSGWLFPTAPVTPAVLNMDGREGGGGVADSAGEDGGESGEDGSTSSPCNSDNPSIAPTIRVDQLNSNGPERGDGESLYSDPSVPLSLFLVEGVLPQGTPGGAKRILPLESTPNTPNSKESEKEKIKGAIVKGSWEAPVKDKTGKLVDQPVTFHPQLRSSGYGQPAEKKVEKKGNSVPRRQSASATRGSQSGGGISTRSLDEDSGPAPKGAGTGSRIRLYPGTCDPMSLHQGYNDYPVTTPGASSSSSSPLSPVYSITYSSDASQLALATADTTVSTLKLPVSRNAGDGQCFLGHNGRVTGVCFSHDKKMLLSSSVDGTAMIWTSGCVDAPAVIISHTKRQASATAAALSSATSTSSFAPRPKLTSYNSYAAAIAAVDTSINKGGDTRNRPFGAEIQAARFFYMDKFVILTVKASVNLYTFQSERDSDTKRARLKTQSFQSYKPAGTLTSIADLNKRQSTGLYERACEWSLSPAQSVTALACVNTVQSPIALCATSDRKLHVLDAAVGCVARTSDCSHERSIHCIALPTPSVHAQVNLDCYNVFATSATDGVISLWDLRAPSVVFRYSGHVNRRELVSIALSPCLRYLATGSEDRSARIIDVRGGKEIVKLQGHRDVVSGVAFNPLFPQLATCSFDGTVKFYVDPTGSDTPMPGL